MTFKFYVGKRVNSRGQVELSLRFRAGKIDQQAATNIRIACAGEDGEVTYPPDVADRMKRLVAYVEDAYCLSRRRKPGKGWLAETIERFHEEQVPLIEEEMRSVPALIDAFLAATESGLYSESRTVAYAMMRRSAARFEAYRRLKLPGYRLTASRLDDVTLKAFEAFMMKEHMWVRKYPAIAAGEGSGGRNKPKSRNTVNDRMKLLKAVMRWAVKTRRIPRNPFDSYAGGGQNVYGTPVYLTLEERHRLEKFNLSRWPRLELQRDIFIFQCCVGCRVSDLVRLTRANIVDGELHYVARKTREESPRTIKVPLNRTALRIVSRYSGGSSDGLFPQVYSLTAYNACIKQAMKLAGLRRRAVVINPLTREPVTKHLYEVASSHMARRTFIGNIYKKFKDQGLVSELSGHSQGSQAFARYREIDLEMKREMVSAID